MPHPLRVLQLNSARLYVGEAAHTLNLAEALRQRGHEVWLGLRENYATFTRAGERGLNPIGFHMPHRWWPPRDLADAKHIARLVRKEQIGLIHAHRGKDHWLAAIAVKLYHLRIPIVRTRHVVTPLAAHAANRWLARRTAALIAVSKAVETEVRGSKLYDGRMAFIPAGIDLELFKPATESRKAAARAALNLPLEALVAVCVARFATVKAHRVLLAAWPQVLATFPSARLVLIGAGLLLKESHDLAQSLGIAGSVLFLGKRYDVPQLLDAADAGVLSSVGSEGFSRAVLEYMAKGLPVVATRVGAVGDLIDDGAHGRLVPPGDERALAGALADVFGATPAVRARWGQAARAKAERGYSYASWAAAHEQLYESLKSC